MNWKEPFGMAQNPTGHHEIGTASERESQLTPVR